MIDDQTRFLRNCIRLLIISLTVIIVIVAVMLGEQMYEFALTFDPDEMYMILIITFAAMMSFVYSEVMLIQFCVNVRFLNLLMIELNEVLVQFCNHEEELAMVKEFY